MQYGNVFKSYELIITYLLYNNLIKLKISNSLFENYNQNEIQPFALVYFLYLIISRL